MSQRSILVIDDDEDFVELMLRKLSKLGYHSLVSALNGEEAFSILKTNKNIGLIISDCMMPELDALSLKEKINFELPNLTIPMLILSGYGTATLRDLAVSLGVKTWLDKPVEDEVLARVLSEYQSSL